MYSLLDKVPFLSKENQDQITNVPSSPGQENDLLSLESIFFNEVKQVDGKNIIQNSTNTMALVNKEFYLPEDYVPEDLVRPEVPFSFGDVENDKSLMRKEAASALEKMFAEAEKAGIELFAVSGYRSYERQKILFDAETSRVGIEQAMQVVAIPGSSEHQSGLAMDISSRAVALNLVEGFADTDEGKWLAENAHRFGFILRYPKGKEQITNYIFEPWHFRYVGNKAAQIIHEYNWTLEEYFNEVKKI
ncbi:D-alanyl-D-alanine carboxypeptidase family protein [Bacillus sp. MRMR6]|uniref:M15 family metallopeptidase n=1 Tax=Bacillus sp. MRMR6 TaxID=1928617 RepID=UPI0020C96359|nr:M15 family metallopeptidase [Bacillus sp. MRMR6]